MDLQWLVHYPRGTPTWGAHLQRAVNVGVRLQGVEIERLMNGIRRRFSFDFRVQNIFAEKDGYLVCKIWKISRVLGWKWHNRIKISRTWWKKIFEKIKTCDISHGGISRIKNSKKDARKKKNFPPAKKKNFSIAFCHINCMWVAFYHTEIQNESSKNVENWFTNVPALKIEKSKSRHSPLAHIHQWVERSHGVTGGCVGSLHWGR